MAADVAAIVPAAGLGKRLGGRTGKPFVNIGGIPLLAHTLRALQSCVAIRWIVPVIRESDRTAIEALIQEYGIRKALSPVTGGPSRAESVSMGFAVVPKAARWVLVHDGARPCVSRSLLKRVVDAARVEGAAVCGLPVSLTVKAADMQGQIRLTLDRSHLWFVQTPQVFRRDWFNTALSQEAQRLCDFPDDAAMIEAAGFPVKIIQGESLNLKVTDRDDLVLAEAILERRQQKSPRTQSKKSRVNRRMASGLSSHV